MTELAEATLELALAQHPRRPGRALRRAAQRRRRRASTSGSSAWASSARASSTSRPTSTSSTSTKATARPTAPQPISAHEYFSQVARGLYTLIGEVTEDGFVFRVDLALRPNGNSGPPVVSLAMLEEYLQAQGREWERFAWLKSRVVAPRASVESGRALALRALVTAFVYRRYLDYGVFEGLRQLHAKVRDEAQRRAAGRPERANDVKLSRGGIREIEFIVQLLLVVRGGQFPEIRTRSTLKALDKLAAGGLMKRASAERLADAYTLLRRIEHRIQYLDDQQTHVLPTARRRPRLDRRQPRPRRRRRHLRAARPARRRARVRRHRVRPLLHDGRKADAAPTAAAPAGRRRSRSTPRPSSPAAARAAPRASSRCASSRRSSCCATRARCASRA